MTERLLQYIWQFQYFNTKELFANTGEQVTILHPGALNTNQGPDFIAAKIKIGDTLMAGSVELHLASADWTKHGHDRDEHYKNVILHVVYKQTGDPVPSIPQIILENRIAHAFLEQYQQWMEQKKFIPCATTLSFVNEIVWITWKERLVVERLIQKASYFLNLLNENRFNWEETFWQALAHGFGGKVNGAAFEQIARTVPVRILARHKNQLITLEAILIGQAGLLNYVASSENEYLKLLHREYIFQQKKYRLPQFQAVAASTLRMRPASFPAIRLAQLAALIYQSSHLFEKMLNAATISDLKELLNVTTGGYWKNHYTIDQPSPQKEKKLGQEMINSLIINVVAPAVFAHGLHHNNNNTKSKALQWLAQLPAEKNKIITQWKQLQVVCTEAAHSQALLQLTNRYCTQKRCLECAVGNALLRQVMNGTK
jgi:hypothetical protein